MNVNNYYKIHIIITPSPKPESGSEQLEVAFTGPRPESSSSPLRDSVTVKNKILSIEKAIVYYLI
jgi:hypothetical protein